MRLQLHVILETSLQIRAVSTQLRTDNCCGPKHGKPLWNFDIQCMHIMSPSSYSLVRSRLFVNVRRSIRVDVVHNAACRAWEHCRCVFNMSWSETCKSQVRFANKFGRTKMGPESKPTQSLNKSLQQPLAMQLTQQKKPEDEAREDKRPRRNSIPSQFPHRHIFPSAKNTFLALWWHQT